MHDAERVSGGERVGGLKHVVHGLDEIELTALQDLLVEVAAFEVLHHHVRDAGRQRADVEDATQVVGLDARSGACLGEEPTDRLLARVELVRDEELDRDDLIERGVSRADDDAHSADAEHTLDAVLAGHDLAFRDRRRERFRNVHATWKHSRRTQLSKRSVRLGSRSTCAFQL